MRNIGLLLILILATEARAEIVTHEVKEGETLQKISQEYFGTTRRWYKIWKQNKDSMEWPNSLEPGMTIKFEGPRAHPEDIAKTEPPAAVEVPRAATETFDVPPPPPLEIPKARPAQVVAKTEAPAAPPAAASAAQCVQPNSQTGSINLVEIQPVSIYRKNAIRGIAATNSKIQRVRVDSLYAVEKMASHPASYEVNHEVPPADALKKEFEGKSHSSNFSSDDMQRFANIQNLDRIQVAQAASQPIEQVVSDLVRGVVESANRIQGDPQRQIASTTPAGKKPRQGGAKKQSFSAIDNGAGAIELKSAATPADEEQPSARRSLPKNLTLRLGTQNLIGPDF